MTDNDHALPIGAVSRMIGISSHTLRKWESRYALVSTQRTTSGRRLYTQEDIEKLILVRDLIAVGHQVNRLAALSNAELEELLSRSNADMDFRDVESVLIVGPVISATARLARHDFAAELEIVSADAIEWLAEDPDMESHDMIVLETPFLSQNHTEQLSQVARRHNLVLVYGYARTADLKALQSRGVICLRAPVNSDDLRRTIESQHHKPLNKPTSVPIRRLPDEVITRISSMLPSIQCECPRHIATLLYDLNSFEKYCHQCEIDHPDDAELHTYLANITGVARASFEEALERVATEEGIPLENNV